MVFDARGDSRRHGEDGRGDGVVGLRRRDELVVDCLVGVYVLVREGGRKKLHFKRENG